MVVVTVVDDVDVDEEAPVGTDVVLDVELDGTIVVVERGTVVVVVGRVVVVTRSTGTDVEVGVEFTGT